MRAFGRPSCSALLRACALLVVVVAQTRCAESPTPPVATKSVAEAPPAQFADDGDERLAVAKAKVLAKELDIEKDAGKRREILGRLVEQTETLPKDPAMRMQMLFLRGMAALELNDSELGWLTAKELRALKASETADDAGLEILAKLDLKGWNMDEKPTWYEVVAREVDAAVVTDAAARSRMEQTKLPWKVRDRKTGIVMLLCPPGEFTMGSPENEPGRRNDEAQQRVSIAQAYYISETEVTQAQWQRVIGANPSRFKGAENPVERVSWDDCQRFCSLTGFRLPSEAEWEYACRAGEDGAFEVDVDSTAWYIGNSGRERLGLDEVFERTKDKGLFEATYNRVLQDNGCKTHPVAQLQPNCWGYFDMCGNVAEWCQDWYHAVSTGTQAAAEDAGSARVLRGGSWQSYLRGVRPCYRGQGASNGLNSGVGFRVARFAL